MDNNNYLNILNAVNKCNQTNQYNKYLFWSCAGLGLLSIYLIYRNTKLKRQLIGSENFISVIEKNLLNTQAEKDIVTFQKRKIEIEFNQLAAANEDCANKLRALENK
jgi:hypothetical protein